MQAGGGDLELFGHVGVAEAVEAPALYQPLGDVKDAGRRIDSGSCGRSRHEEILPEVSRRRFNKAVSSVIDNQSTSKLSCGTSAGTISSRGGFNMQQTTSHRTFGTPDEKREFPNGRAEILSIDDTQIG